MKFRRIEQSVPNKRGIFSKTQYVEIDERSFLEKFADSARAVLVSDDGISDPEERTAWGFGILRCWFIDED